MIYVSHAGVLLHISRGRIRCAIAFKGDCMGGTVRRRFAHQETGGKGSLHGARMYLRYLNYLTRGLSLRLPDDWRVNIPRARHTCNLVAPYIIELPAFQEKFPIHHIACGSMQRCLLLQMMGQGMALLMPEVVVSNNDWTSCSLTLA